MITYPQPFKKVSILKDVDDICPNDAPCNINKEEIDKVVDYCQNKLGGS